MLSRMEPAPLDIRRMSLAPYSVTRAFAFSIFFHFLLFVFLEVGYRTGLWNTTLLFSKEQAAKEEMARMQAEMRKRQEEMQEIPMLFVEVDPTQATDEAPPEAKYYSSLNTKAANPDIRTDLGAPKIEGKQERIPQTMDRAKPEAPAVQPEAAPEPQTQQQQQPEPEPAIKPQPATRPETPPKGDLAMVKPAEKPQEEVVPKRTENFETAKPKPVRPRTLEAARRQRGGMAGEKMKQPGGVKRFSLEPSFDVRSTPFGAYDAAIIAAIQKHWYDLLEHRDFAANYTGKVVLEFRLNADGRVSDMRVRESDVTEILSLLCQRAVQDPAPFMPWPADMRRMIGKEYRDVRFTFYYN